MSTEERKAADAGEDPSFVYRGKRIEIREVWAHNLEAEMAVIRELVDQYPFVAMVRSACRCVVHPGCVGVRV